MYRHLMVLCLQDIQQVQNMFVPELSMIVKRQVQVIRILGQMFVNNQHKQVELQLVLAHILGPVQVHKRALVLR